MRCTPDAYCGSGTIGLAVRKNGEGRRYIGTDIDEDHDMDARHRIVEEVK